MTTLHKKKIWALLDERQGNTSQTIGVAEALGLPFETRQIEFNEFIRIPNLFINKSTVGIRNKSVLAPPWPDMVLSTARRLGIVASYIKFQSPATFLAQIQWPGFPAEHFDLIATPKHDNIPPGGNVFLTVGAPHRVTSKILAKSAEEWNPKVADLASPRIAVLIGGSTRLHKFTAKHAQHFAALASRLAKTLDGSLLVTTSRRTGDEATAAIKTSLSAPHYFYAWNEREGKDNPFYGFLGLADAVIATGDSISMCSEACATGKAVYIYSSRDFVASKHQGFVDELFRLGLAQPLTENSTELFIPPYRLDDSASIAEEIRRRCPL